MIWIMLGVMFLLLFLGFPIMIPLIVAPLLIAIIYFPDLNLMVFIQQFSLGIQTFVLLAVPMFIFAADIMAKGKHLADCSILSAHSSDIFEEGMQSPRQPLVRYLARFLVRRKRQLLLSGSQRVNG